TRPERSISSATARSYASGGGDQLDLRRVAALALDRGDGLDAHRRVGDAGRDELVDERVAHARDEIVRRVRARDDARQDRAVALVDELVLPDIQKGRERRAQAERVHRPLSSSRGAEAEDVARAPVDTRDPDKRAAARVRTLGEHDRIRELVADERLSAVRQAREQHLAARLA